MLASAASPSGVRSRRGIVATVSEETNWASNYVYRAKTILHPQTMGELQDLVARHERVKALGSRHCFNDIADSPGALIATGGLPDDVVVNPGQAPTVTVPAGATYGAVVSRLHEAGYALANLASLPHISIGGAIATGTHGSGDHNGSLAAAVAAIDIVIADGALLTLRRGEPDFAGTVVNLGALGIATRVTLDVVPTFTVCQNVFTNLPWAALEQNFDAITSAAYSVSLFTDWVSPAVNQVWLKSRGEVYEEPDLFGAQPATAAMHPLPGLSAVNCTDQLGAAGPWYERLSHFRLGFTPSNGTELQSEYLLPRRHALQAIDALRGLGECIAPLLLVSEIRTIAPDDLWLSPNGSEPAVAFHFTWQQHQEDVEALLPAIESALEPFGARPHWGKVFTTTPQHLEHLYPRLGDFRALAARLDPAGKFRNLFLDRTVFG